MRLWSLADPAAPTPVGVPLTGHDGRVRAVAFAPDGSLLASASLDGTGRLWSLAGPAAPTRLGAPLTGHFGMVWAVAFAPDGSLLASAGDDGVIRLWDLTSLSSFGIT